MDFNDTPSEAAYRAKARAWLDANAARKTAKKDSLPALSLTEALERARTWQRTKAEGGFACITWPKEYGGQGGSSLDNVVYSQEESNYLVPGGFYAIGLGMCLPTVLAWGTEAHKERYVAPAVRGDEIWCQLFSEPAGGSDVAGLRTRAEKDGDEWVINGQKVWTSGAHYCDYGIVVVRTDPNVPKHKGLTMFIIDMKAPGVEVRPIKQMSGESEFNEVFFTDVRIPDSDRLGEPGQGWKVALTTLMNERLAVGGGGGADWEELLGLAQEAEMEQTLATANSAVRERIADWYVQTQGLKYTRFRTLTALSKGQTPGPESSISKIVSATKMQELGSFAMDLQGQHGIVRDREISPNAAVFQNQWMGGAGYRIAGGTDEILRNIVAERVLGMPQDIRVDKDKPFSEMPAGK